MKSIMKQIINHDGIIAVGHRTDKSLGISLTFKDTSVAVDRTKWETRLNSACQLLNVAEENLGHEVCLRGSNVSALKVIMGGHVWNIQHQEGDYLIIVSIKGHQITKSLQRMVRRGMEKIKNSYGTMKVAGRRFVPRIVEDPPAIVPSKVAPVTMSVKEATDRFTKPAMPRRFDHLRDDDDGV